MICPKCGIELRVKERQEDGTVLLVCRNPRCENYQANRVVATIK